MPPPIEAELHAHFILRPEERRLTLGLTAEATGGLSFTRAVTFDIDMLYNRTQEHLNNALRAITNQLMKEFKNER